ncbi:MAG: terminase small subunit [Hyphomicrobiales bacterium]|nr:MAG: terminase small subunit [Hyphomicrobiales bacterium]
MAKSNLTNKQQKFIDEYLQDLNATQAAIRAGYSEKTAQMIGSENLSKPMIAEAIALKRQEIADKAEWSAVERLKMLGDIAQANSDGDPRVSVSAIAEANKMQGSHAPTKSELTGKDGGPIAVVKTLADFYADPKSSS